MQGEDKLAQKDARPDPGAKTKGEGEGNSFRNEENRGDEDIVDLGQKTEPAGEGVEQSQHETEAGSGAERFQGTLSLSLSLSRGKVDKGFAIRIRIRKIRNLDFR